MWVECESREQYNSTTKIIWCLQNRTALALKCFSCRRVPDLSYKYYRRGRYDTWWHFLANLLSLGQMGLFDWGNKVTGREGIQAWRYIEGYLKAALFFQYVSIWTSLYLRLNRGIVHRACTSRISVFEWPTNSIVVIVVLKLVVIVVITVIVILIVAIAVMVVIVVILRSSNDSDINSSSSSNSSNINSCNISNVGDIINSNSSNNSYLVQY